MEPWELAAREAIRDLVARYNANGDAGRIDQVVELFTPDAVMDIEGVEYAGHEAIRGMFSAVVRQVADGTPSPTGERSGRALMQHHTSSLQIDLLDEHTATSRCYLQVLMPHGLDHWGRYLDHVAYVDGRWLFTRRRITVDGRAPGGWAARLVERPDAAR